MSDRIPQWLIKGLDEDAKKDIIKRYEVAKPILSRLRSELEKRVQRSYIDEEHVITDSMINVASTIGERRGFRGAMDLIPVK